MTDDGVRAEVALRWRIWQPGHFQRRKYALLVTGYCRLQFGHRWGRHRQTLLTAAEQIAGRSYPHERAAELQTFAQQLLDRANRSLILERNSIEYGHAIPLPRGWDPDEFPSLGEADAIRLLALSVDQPERAAEELVGSPLTDLDCLLGVLECLRPADWEPRSEWVEVGVPRDAHLWARRIYDTQDFSSLAVLADRIEDSDCPDQPLLAHCRCTGPHVRGCAAVDRLCGYTT